MTDKREYEMVSEQIKQTVRIHGSYILPATEASELVIDVLSDMAKEGLVTGAASGKNIHYTATSNMPRSYVVAPLRASELQPEQYIGKIGSYVGRVNEHFFEANVEEFNSLGLILKVEVKKIPKNTLAKILRKNTIEKTFIYFYNQKEPLVVEATDLFHKFR